MSDTDLPRLLAANENTLVRLQSISQLQAQDNSTDDNTAGVQSEIAVVIEVFEDLMLMLNTELNGLIVSGESCVSQLKPLELQLKSIHQYIARDTSSTYTQYSLLSKSLFGKMGFNWRKIDELEHKLQMLAQTLEYRNRALAYVVAALMGINGKKIEMGMLLKDVSRPPPNHKHISLENQTKSIIAGVQELKKSKALLRAQSDVLAQQVLLDG